MCIRDRSTPMLLTKLTSITINLIIQNTDIEAVSTHTSEAVTTRTIRKATSSTIVTLLIILLSMARMVILMRKLHGVLKSIAIFTKSLSTMTKVKVNMTSSPCITKDISCTILTKIAMRIDKIILCHGVASGSAKKIRLRMSIFIQ